ncbi:hypothetical protein GMRT_15320 [Giardia muris]|uniref:Coiled-coil protein n=1 Tax=Giardia muris TaxID=5742 RepID=A0A4Z1T8R2_GIAMU|nr:hypothetical protein GMRT_15320 [Giardia muris]|eukprot:TNJ28901.1 hypothetical protein GMRT_15320 [Giardia muris]
MSRGSLRRPPRVPDALNASSGLSAPLAAAENFFSRADTFRDEYLAGLKEREDRLAVRADEISREMDALTDKLNQVKSREARAEGLRLELARLETALQLKTEEHTALLTKCRRLEMRNADLEHRIEERAMHIVQAQESLKRERRHLYLTKQKYRAALAECEEAHEEAIRTGREVARRSSELQERETLSRLTQLRKEELEKRVEELEARSAVRMRELDERERRLTAEQIEVTAQREAMRERDTLYRAREEAILARERQLGVLLEQLGAASKADERASLRRELEGIQTDHRHQAELRELNSVIQQQASNLAILEAKLRCLERSTSSDPRLQALEAANEELRAQLAAVVSIQQNPPPSQAPGSASGSGSASTIAPQPVDSALAFSSTRALSPMEARKMRRLQEYESILNRNSRVDSLVLSTAETMGTQRTDDDLTFSGMAPQRHSFGQVVTQPYMLTYRPHGSTRSFAVQYQPSVASGPIPSVPFQTPSHTMERTSLHLEDHRATILRDRDTLFRYLTERKEELDHKEASLSYVCDQLNTRLEECATERRELESAWATLDETVRKTVETNLADARKTHLAELEALRNDGLSPVEYLRSQPFREAFVDALTQARARLDVEELLDILVTYVTESTDRYTRVIPQSRGYSETTRTETPSVIDTAIQTLDDLADLDLLKSATEMLRRSFSQSPTKQPPVPMGTISPRPSRPPYPQLSEPSASDISGASFSKSLSDSRSSALESMVVSHRSSNGVTHRSQQGILGESRTAMDLTGVLPGTPRSSEPEAEPSDGRKSVRFSKVVEVSDDPRLYEHLIDGRGGQPLFESTMSLNTYLTTFRPLKDSSEYSEPKPESTPPKQQPGQPGESYLAISTLPLPSPSIGGTHVSDIGVSLSRKDFEELLSQTRKGGDERTNPFVRQPHSGHEVSSTYLPEASLSVGTSRSVPGGRGTEGSDTDVAVDSILFT